MFSHTLVPWELGGSPAVAEIKRARKKERKKDRQKERNKEINKY